MKIKPVYTVARLIEELKKFPLEMPVVTDGYEEETENMLDPRVITVKLIEDEAWYNEQFHQIGSDDPEGFQTVVIRREKRDY
jgi:hypothetical protein